jgi:hypothetical protein
MSRISSYSHPAIELPAGLGKTVFKQLVFVHFLIKIGCLNNCFAQPWLPELPVADIACAEQLSAVIKLYNSRLLGTPNTTTIIKTTATRRKKICTLQQRGL